MRAGSANGDELSGDAEAEAEFGRLMARFCSHLAPRDEFPLAEREEDSGFPLAEREKDVAVPLLGGTALEVGAWRVILKASAKLLSGCVERI